MTLEREQYERGWEKCIKCRTVCPPSAFENGVCRDKGWCAAAEIIRNARAAAREEMDERDPEGRESARIFAEVESGYRERRKRAAEKRRTQRKAKRRAAETPEQRAARNARRRAYRKAKREQHRKELES